ncbi:MAG TPA: SufD family Fe-S cluster assembly protein [archaeon]|nr:SufD family Fe-S cluster assembly protein [archaeon]
MAQQNAKAQSATQMLAPFREKNLRVFSEKPVKKSKYTSIAKLEEMLFAKKEQMSIVPKIISGSAKLLTLDDAFAQMPEKMAKMLAKEEKPRDQFDAFINSNFNCSFAMVLGKNSGNVVFELEVPQGACAKYFIIAEKGSNATLFEKINAKGNALAAQTVLVEENSTLSIAKIHNENSGAVMCQQSIVEKDSELNNCNAWFEGTLVRGNTVNILDGDGAKANEFSLLLSKGKQHFDLQYSSIHRAAGTESHCVFKSALRDESKMVFDGMIRIEESGSKTNALLECHSMIMGEKASSNQIPSLEIKTDDVKATHSATVAKIDEEEMFYLQSRGIEKESARKMVVKSFLESIIYLLPEALRPPLLEEIEYRV